MNLRLVTVDITNTLVRFKKPPAVQYRDIARLYGIEIDDKILDDSLRSSIKNHSKSSPNFGFKDKGWINWWQHVIKDTFVTSGARANDSEFEIIGFHLLRHFSTGEAYEILPHCIDLLRFLNEKPLILGTISNTDERLEKVLISLGLRHYFNFVLSSFEAGAAKPDKNIFLAALRKAGNGIKASESLHIGDSLRLDVLSAENAGWNAFLVSEDFQDQCSKLNVKFKPNSMFSDLNELKIALDKLF